MYRRKLNISIKNLNTLAGGLASSAVSFAFTGNATFNILNLTDFGTRINGGLLEFTIGKDGISSKIGNGGTNISYSNIKSSIRGASSLHKNSQINNTKYDKQTKDALRSQWGFGDKTAKKQLEEIIKGDTILKLDADGSEVAQSINENGQKIIHLNSSQNEGFIDLGLILQHEAHRDGIVSDEQSQYIETVNAVAGHTQMALAMAIDKLYTKDMLNHISSDTNLQNDINAYMYAAYTGNTSLFAGYVGASYDSSADYWKFTKEGNIYWDGSDNLYDENGKLLHEYSGTGTGHTDALREALGITHAEANQMLVDADYKWDSEKKTFVDSNGNDVKNDSSKAAITSDMIKVRYDFQHNYVDKLNGAPMHSAVMSFQNDMMLGNQNIAVSPEFYKSNKYLDFIVNSYTFANEYDKAMEKYGNVGKKIISSDIFDKIAMDFDNNKFSADNYFYKFAEQISPVVGTDYITTMYTYDDGSLHSKDLNSLAIDFGTWGKDLPLVTTEYETILINNSLGFKDTSGYNITTYTELFSKYYAHLQYNSNAYKQIVSLNQKAYDSKLWTYQLPPNYQFGNVGISGELGFLWDGPHIHMQYKRINP